MTTPQKGRIFISYRRADSQFAAGRIYDRLMAHFGEEAIFMDVEAIDGGVDFVKVLENAVQSCDVVLVVIGKTWLNIKDERGERRLDNPDDFVRIEVAVALSREIRVIPVLVEHAIMPRSNELPENLQLLARRNALQVNHQSFNADANRLIAHIERALVFVEAEKKRKAQDLQEERNRALRQNQIAKLHTQADTAIAVKDWSLAKKKLKDVLSLDEDDLNAQAKLELVDEKLAALQEEKKAQKIAQEEALKEKAAQAQARAAQERADRLAREKRDAEEKARQDALRKERREQRKENLKEFFSKNGKFLFFSAGGVAIVFVFGYLISKIEPPAEPVPTKAPTTQVLSTATLALPTSTLGVGSTMISEKDGMTLVYVPAGEFQMGSENGGSDENTIHTVYLDAYWIDQTEVTNAMYAKCVADGVCDEPSNRGSYSRDSYYGNAEFDNYPVIYVSWEDANNYCEWAERRLPTEAEWEKAAGWDDDTQSQMVYPWGNDLGAFHFG